MLLSIKRFLLKNSAIKIGILAVLLIVDVIVMSVVINKFMECSKITKESTDYKESIEEVITSSSSNLKGSDVFKTLSGMDAIKSINSIVKLDSSSSRKVVGNIQLDSLKTLDEDCVIEFVFESTDVNKSLDFLSKSELSYDYLSVDLNNVITCRVYVKGGKEQ